MRKVLMIAPVSRSYDLDAFEKIVVVGPHHIVVSVGPAFSVRAEGPQQTLADTEVEVEDGRLKIHPIDDGRWERRCGEDAGDHDDWRGRCWDDYEPATFHVTLPAISGASLVGGGDMRIDRVEGEEFSASVAGSRDLDVATLRVDDARFSIAGSGDVALTVRDDARVSIVGGGDVDITGPARCAVSRFGGGTVRCGGEDVDS